MTKDLANIFKLDKEDLEKYKGKEFDDCMPGAEDFAKCLKSYIETKDTPYVLLLEDNFGMGKTHFSTRFTYYLRNNNINAIYFSAWENDYIERPFVSFSAEILKYFTKIKPMKTKFKKVTKAIKNLVLNIAKSTSFSVGVNMGVSANASVNNEKAITAVEDFINSFIDKEDYIHIFKKQLKDFLAGEKLVIIVDELDRCRPDYAMKTLEIIKHFFDIEGLFVIVPTNRISLQKSVQALYGIDDSAKDNPSEKYITKFFTDKIKLYDPDYKSIVNNIVTRNALLNLIEKRKMTVNTNYNSLIRLQEKLAEYGQKCKYTMREMVNICHKAIYYCNYINNRIDSEYIAYKLCLKYTRNQYSNIKLSKEHPFNSNATLKKDELLTFQVPHSVYDVNGYNYQSDFKEYLPFFNDRKFETYKEFEDFYEKFNNTPKTFDEYCNQRTGYYYVKRRFDFSKLENYINQKKMDIDEYRKLWGSNDKDNEVKKYYDDIIDNEIKIHK